MKETLLHTDTTGKIINSFYQIYNTLGYGFLEKVYENALAFVLRDKGCEVHQQHPIQVYLAHYLIGQYYADLLVNNSVIVEVKAAEAIKDEHEAQLLNYLKATKVEIGLILNFGPEARFVRKIFTNEKKRMPR